MRIDKYLCELNKGTRKEVKEYIKKGQIRVNGNIVKDPGYKVDENNDTVEFINEILTYNKYVYYMLNKPAGVVSATEDKHDKTVIDLIKPEDIRPGLFPVGRLDKDTVGLLLISNDGELAHNLLSPTKHVDKTYFVKVKGALKQEHVEMFRQGLQLSDFITKPAILEIVSTGEESSAKVTIKEGKFHQVKRMFAKIGTEVVYLERIQMANLKLDEHLLQGEYRALRDDELSKLLD